MTAKEVTEGAGPKDYVLALLFAQRDRPVKGTLMLVKLVFLASKQVDERIGDLMSFFPWDFGPYSSVLANSVSALVGDGLVFTDKEPSTANGNDRVDYSLSPAGMRAAAEAFARLPPDVQSGLARLRKGGTQLGYSGILRLVYTRYPEYAIASKIRDKVFKES